MSSHGFVLAAALASLAGAIPASAITRNVPAEHATIQSALDASSFGDVVRVAPGTYVENLFVGPRHSGVRLMSASGPHVTEIRGDRTRSVVICEDVSALTVIEGFTITNGGDGLTTLGGGLRLQNSRATIRGNVIRDNHAAAAGGVYVDGGHPQILDNTIADNTANIGSGGGIYCDHRAAPRIEGNVIARNGCPAYGGGVSVWERSEPILIGNTIVANRADLGGGGVYVERDSHPECVRNIVAFSTAGGGITVGEATSTKPMLCNDTFGNDPVDYSGFPDPTGTNGNLSEDPLFCDLDSLDVTLMAGSPCAAETSEACGQIGAREVACGALPVILTTLARLKALYR